jgi:hypothetical protein
MVTIGKSTLGCYDTTQHICHARKTSIIANKHHAKIAR